MRHALIGSTAAAELISAKCGARRSRQIVIFWARSGRLKPARTRPTIKFRIEDVLAFAPPPPRPGTGRPTQLRKIAERMTNA